MRLYWRTIKDDVIKLIGTRNKNLVMCLCIFKKKFSSGLCEVIWGQKLRKNSK